MDKKALYNLLQNLNEDDQVSIRSYSGRGMYDKNCVGFSGDLTDIMRLFLYAVSHITEDLETLDAETVAMFLSEFSMDSMGLNSIVYFPRWSWEDMQIDDEDEADDEN